MKPEMQNPQPGKAKGIQVYQTKKLCDKHSIIFGFTQSPDSNNNYITDYHNTEYEDLREIEAHLLGCGEVDQ